MGKSAIPSSANKAVNFIRAIYNWAEGLDVYDGANPATGRYRYTCPPRERFLSLEEVQRYVAGLEILAVKPRAYLWTMLLTGARGIEIRSMRWGDLDWATRLWRKPTTKNGTPQFLPLPIQIIDAFKVLLRRSEWVFCGTEKRAWSKASAQKV